MGKSPHINQKFLTKREGVFFNYTKEVSYLHAYCWVYDHCVVVFMIYGFQTCTVFSPVITLQETLRISPRDTIFSYFDISTLLHTNVYSSTKVIRLCFKGFHTENEKCSWVKRAFKSPSIVLLFYFRLHTFSSCIQSNY